MCDSSSSRIRPSEGQGLRRCESGQRPVQRPPRILLSVNTQTRDKESDFKEEPHRGRLAWDLLVLSQDDHCPHIRLFGHGEGLQCPPVPQQEGSPVHGHQVGLVSRKNAVTPGLVQSICSVF